MKRKKGVPACGYTLFVLKIFKKTWMELQMGLQMELQNFQKKEVEKYPIMYKWLCKEDPKPP